jgi:ribosome biogenesis GTPase
MDLHVLGWNAHWRDLFTAYDSQSLLPGRVVVEHRGAYRIEMEPGERSGALAGRLRHQAGRRADLPAVGDFVAVRLPEAGAGDGPAVIEGVLPRRTALVRRAAGARPDDQVIAANIDTVFVMTGLDHDFNVRRIERYLAAVWESGANPVVLLNKADVCADVGMKIDELRAAVIGVDVHVLILNRLLGRDVQTTVGVRAHDSRGRHTTTHRELFVLPRGGLVIDTPGMREFTLSDAGEGVEAVFGDIDALAARCRFADCAHRGEPGCAVHDAVERGELATDRVAAFHKLLNELRYEESRGDRVAAAERKRRGRIGAKAIRRMKRDAES